MKDVLTKLKNPGTLVAVVSGVVLILTTNGVAVDSVAVMTTVKAICAIGLALGVMNNPDTKGINPTTITKEDSTEN